MKLLLATLAAGATSVLPTALADERAAEPKPFIITLSSEITPISHGVVRYPTYAGARSLSGGCEVSFAVSVTGEPDAIRVGTCTSEAFRASAKAAVETMTFAPRSVVAENVRMRIGWTLEQPVMQTAALN